MICHPATSDPAGWCPIVVPLHSHFSARHSPFLKTGVEPFWVSVHAHRKWATLVLSFLGSVNNSSVQRICLANSSVAQLSILYSSSMNELKPLFAFSSNCPPPLAWDLWKFVARVAEPRYFSQAWCPTATTKITSKQLLSQKGGWMHLLPKDHNANPGRRRSGEGGQWMQHSLSLSHFCRNL